MKNAPSVLLIPTDMKLNFSKPSIAVPAACLCCLLWASAFPFIKIGYRLFGIDGGDSASQILFAGLRFIIAGLLSLAIGSAVSGKALRPKKGSFKYIAALAAVQTVIQYVLFYLGLARTSSAKASVINAASVFFAMFAAAAVFKDDKLSVRKILGALAGFAGIIVMNLDGLRLGFRFTGEGFILLSALSYAASSVLIKNFSEKENPVTLSGFQFILGGAVMTAAGLAAGGKFTSFSSKAAAVLLYLGFLSAAAYSLWGILLKHNAVSHITVFGFVTPIGGVLLSALLLGEKTGALKCAAALALVSVGIILVNMDFKKENTVSERR